MWWVHSDDLLAGLVVCGGCGRHFAGTRATGRNFTYRSTPPADEGESTNDGAGPGTEVGSPVPRRRGDTLPRSALWSRRTIAPASGRARARVGARPTWSSPSPAAPP